MVKTPAAYPKQPPVATARLVSALPQRREHGQTPLITANDLPIDHGRSGWRWRKARLPSVLRKSRPGVRLNEHLEHRYGTLVFAHACKLGAEGIGSKRLGSPYSSGRSPDWLKFKNPLAPAVEREAEEDWGR